MSSKHCQIDFDRQKKIFRLTAPIASRKIESIHEYVEARGGQTFRPHSTFFCIDNQENVRVVQEISFTQDPSMLRRHLIEFWRLANFCTQMLEEIAEEESFSALSVD